MAIAFPKTTPPPTGPKNLGEDPRLPEDHEVSINMSGESLAGVLEAGEVRNDFHPDVPKRARNSPGYAQSRIQTEHDKLNVPLDAGHEDRPVYGAVRDVHEENPADIYGPHRLDIALSTGRPRERVTTTEDDSMARTVAQDPARTLDETSVAEDRGPYRYREAQIFGGVPLARITRVAMRTFAPARGRLDHYDRAAVSGLLNLRDKVLRTGIPVSIVRRQTFEQPTLSLQQFGPGHSWTADETVDPAELRRRLL